LREEAYNQWQEKLRRSFEESSKLDQSKQLVHLDDAELRKCRKRPVGIEVPR
jgi:hypothetical protein